MKFKREGIFYVYIVQCLNGAYYTGSTTKLEKRIESHNKGNGAKYLKGKSPVRLAYVKEYKYYKNAIHAERNIKKLTRQQKEELVRIYAESKKCD